jgi:HK97 gp10 family phage protein
MGSAVATKQSVDFGPLDRALAQLPKTTAGNVLTRTLMKAADPIWRDAVANAPDNPETGAPDLHTSIFKKKGKNGQRIFRRTVNVMLLAPNIRNEKTNITTGIAFYGPALEKGTGDMPAKPFMRPAFDNNVQISIKIIGDELKAEIEKAAARIAKKRGA